MDEETKNYKTISLNVRGLAQFKNVAINKSNETQYLQHLQADRILCHPQSNFKQ